MSTMEHMPSNLYLIFLVIFLGEFIVNQMEHLANQPNSCFKHVQLFGLNMFVIFV